MTPGAAAPRRELAFARRVRRTPYTARVEANGAWNWSVYNHMLLPEGFAATVEEDYWHLREHVQIWDVACERQVELRGPDAARLAQLMTPRDLAGAEPGRCLYAPIVDRDGYLVNDPLALKLADDRFWLSIADADVLLYALGLAAGRGLEVIVSEPDVHPLAIQGPRADDVAAAVFGDAVRAIRFFRFAWLEFAGRPLLVARSGWSKQGGFEIYLDEPALAEQLWDAVVAAGAPHAIRPGYPHPIERIEGALLSYGNDVTRTETPLEAGLERYCDGLDTGVDCIGAEALRRRRADGIGRRIRGLALDGPAVPEILGLWPVRAGGTPAGDVTSAAWSPRLERNVCLGLIDREAWAAGTPVEVLAPDGPRTGRVCDLPFPGALPGS